MPSAVVPTVDPERGLAVAADSDLVSRFPLSPERNSVVALLPLLEELREVPLLGVLRFIPGFVVLSDSAGPADLSEATPADC